MNNIKRKIEFENVNPCHAPRLFLACGRLQNKPKIRSFLYWPNLTLSSKATVDVHVAPLNMDGGRKNLGGSFV